LAAGDGEFSPKIGIDYELPSGKRLQNYGKSMLLWVNPLFRLGHGFKSILYVYQAGYYDLVWLGMIETIRTWDF
jgi:hypothetical protein